MNARPSNRVCVCVCLPLGIGVIMFNRKIALDLWIYFFLIFRWYATAPSFGSCMHSTHIHWMFVHTMRYRLLDFDGNVPQTSSYCTCRSRIEFSHRSNRDCSDGKLHFRYTSRFRSIQIYENEFNERSFLFISENCVWKAFDDSRLGSIRVTSCARQPQ